MKKVFIIILIISFVIYFLYTNNKSLNENFQTPSSVQGKASLIVDSGSFSTSDPVNTNNIVSMNTQSWVDFLKVNLTGTWKQQYNNKDTGIQYIIDSRGNTNQSSARTTGLNQNNNFIINYTDKPENENSSRPVINVGNMFGFFDESDPTELRIFWKVPYSTVRSDENTFRCWNNSDTTGSVIRTKEDCESFSNDNNKFTFDDSTGIFRHKWKGVNESQNCVYADYNGDENGRPVRVGQWCDQPFQKMERTDCRDNYRSRVFLHKNSGREIHPDGGWPDWDNDILLWDNEKCFQSGDHNAGWKLWYGNGNWDPYAEPNFGFDERYRWVRITPKSQGGYGSVSKLSIWNADGFKLGSGYKTYSSSQGSSSDGYCFIKVRFNKNFVDENNQPYKPDLIQFTVSNLDAGTDDNAIRYNVVVDSINQTDFVIRVSKWYKSWINSMRINWYAIKYL